MGFYGLRIGAERGPRGRLLHGSALSGVPLIPGGPLPAGKPAPTSPFLPLRRSTASYAAFGRKGGYAVATEAPGRSGVGGLGFELQTFR